LSSAAGCSGLMAPVCTGSKSLLLRSSRYPATPFLEMIRATLMRGRLRLGGCDDSFACFAAHDARLLSMVHRDDTAGGAAVVKNRRHVGNTADQLGLGFAYRQSRPKVPFA